MLSNDQIEESLHILQKHDISKEQRFRIISNLILHYYHYCEELSKGNTSYLGEAFNALIDSICKINAMLTLNKEILNELNVNNLTPYLISRMKYRIQTHRSHYRHHLSLDDLLEKKKFEIVDKYDRTKLLELVEHLYSCCSNNEEKLVLELMLEQHTVREIGIILQIPKSRVHEIKMKIRRRYKERTNS